MNRYMRVRMAVAALQAEVDRLTVIMHHLKVALAELNEVVIDLKPEPPERDPS